MIVETIKRLSEEFQRQMEIAKSRRRIDACILKADWDGIGALPEFRIVQRADTFLKPVNCFTYLFGEGGEDDDVFSQQKAFKILRQYRRIPIDQMQTGDYVIYFDRRSVMAHVGISVDSKRVQSKFGFAHVYEHPISLVPTDYGKTIWVFRKPAI